MNIFALPRPEPAGTRQTRGNALVLVMLMIGAVGLIVGSSVMISSANSQAVRDKALSEREELSASSFAAGGNSNASIITRIAMTMIPKGVEEAVESSGQLRATGNNHIDRAVLDQIQINMDNASCFSSMSSMLQRSSVKIRDLRIHFTDSACYNKYNLADERMRLRSGNLGALQLPPIKAERIEGAYDRQRWTIPFLMRWESEGGNQMSKAGRITLITGTGDSGRWGVISTNNSVSVNDSLVIDSNVHAQNGIRLGKQPGNWISGMLTAGNCQADFFKLCLARTVPEGDSPSSWQTNPVQINTTGMPCVGVGANLTCAAAESGGNTMVPTLTETARGPNDALTIPMQGFSSIEIWYGPWESQYATTPARTNDSPSPYHPQYINAGRIDDSPVYGKQMYYVPGNPYTQFVRGCASGMCTTLYWKGGVDFPLNIQVGSRVRLSTLWDNTLVNGYRVRDRFPAVRDGSNITVSTVDLSQTGTTSGGVLEIASNLTYDTHPCGARADEPLKMVGGLNTTGCSGDTLLTLIGDIQLSREMEFVKSANTAAPNVLTIDAQIISGNTLTGGLISSSSFTNNRGQMLDTLRIFGNYAASGPIAFIDGVTRSGTTSTGNGRSGGYDVVIDYDPRLLSGRLGVTSVRYGRQLLGAKLEMQEGDAQQFKLMPRDPVGSTPAPNARILPGPVGYGPRPKSYGVQIRPICATPNPNVPSAPNCN